MMDDFSCLETWSKFQKNFVPRYFDILGNDRLKKLSKWSSTDLFESPHILFYGNEPTYLALCVEAVLRKMFNVDSCVVPKKAEFLFNNASVKHTAIYKHTDQWIEVDMSKISSGEKTFLTEFLYKHIGFTKNIHQEKHVIVLTNVHTMSSHSWFSLRRPLESLSRNVVFLMTTPTLNKIDSTIRSRFMHVHCSISPDDIGIFFENFVEDLDISCERDIELDVDKSLCHNILELSKYVENSPQNNNDKESYIDEKLENFVKDLLREKNLLKALENIRSFGYRILHFDIPLAVIMKYTIKILSKNKKCVKHIHDIVSHAALMQHKSLGMHRHILVFENFFIYIYKTYNS